VSREDGAAKGGMNARRHDDRIDDDSLAQCALNPSARAQHSLLRGLLSVKANWKSAKE
jgi:hypothetical protein